MDTSSVAIKISDALRLLGWSPEMSEMLVELDGETVFISPLPATSSSGSTEVLSHPPLKLVPGTESRPRTLDYLHEIRPIAHQYLHQQCKPRDIFKPARN